MKALEMYKKLGKFVCIDKKYAYSTLSARIEVGVEMLKDVESYEEYMALNAEINKDVDRLNKLKRREENHNKAWFQDGSDRIATDEDITIIIIKNGQIGGHRIF